LFIQAVERDRALDAVVWPTAKVWQQLVLIAMLKCARSPRHGRKRVFEF
jgi:hypothetical protein